MTALIKAPLARWKQLDPLMRFVPVFLVYQLLITFCGEKLVRNYPVLHAGLATTMAQAEYWIFSLFTDDISMQARTVTYSGFPVTIVGECVGLLEFMIYTAAILAFPASWRQRAIGLVCGLPLLYLFNLVRIMMLLLVGASSAELFEFFHVYFWQITLVLLVGGVWLLWVLLVVRREDRAVVHP